MLSSPYAPPTAIALPAAAPRLVLVLHGNAALRASVRAAAAGARVGELESWHEVEVALRRAAPGTQAVVDPYFGTAGAALSPGFGALRARFPSVSLLAALEVGKDRVEDLRALHELGASEVATMPWETTERCMERLLHRSRSRPFTQAVKAALPLLHVRATAAVLSAADVVCRGGGVAALAAAMAAEPGTLPGLLRRGGAPAPEALVRRVRAVLAAFVLDDPGRTPEDAARACGADGEEGLARLLDTPREGWRRCAGGGRSPPRWRRWWATSTARAAWTRRPGRAARGWPSSPRSEPRNARRFLDNGGAVR